MNNFNLFTGNQMESLAREFSKIVAEPLSSPFAPEIVVVQSKGMERWLSLQVAMHNSVCANFIFQFPDAFAGEIFGLFNLNVKHPSPFKAGVMTFSIMKVLPCLIAEPGFEDLKLYFGDSMENKRLFQIASCIASVFEQYLVFRPEMILKWEEGSEDNWQAKLWRKIAVIDNEYSHYPTLQRAFLECIKNNNTKPAGLPERVSVFGISYLPPFYLQIFTALSNLIPVNFFLMNPCSEYWGDIVSDREIKKINRRYLSSACRSDALHLEKGNSLLSSMGILGRDFLGFILNTNCNIFEMFEEKNSKSILSSIQSDILYLKDRDLKEPEEVFETDASVQINSCHSPMREIEVLHDCLLSFFEESGDLLPKDIIVMAPDIEIYSPFIKAVFDSQTDRALRIPYSISDLSAVRESLFIDTFISVLSLKESRLEATRIHDLLGSFWIRQKFGLDISDINIIQKWIKDTNIKWGMDDKHRVEKGLPGHYENTWKAGMKRILLGYAMTGSGRKMFSGILPYDNIEGENAKTAGRFIEFLNAVFECMKQLAIPKSLTRWRDYLHEILCVFFMHDDNVTFEIKILEEIFDDFLDDEKLSGFDDKIELEVIRSYILSRLEKKYFGAGFLSYGVTFCSALPMRSIPFRIICLIGMNNDDFPRNNFHHGFDLMAKEPRPLDRSRRNDDKYLFLEAIVSAREKLYISYIGQDVRDNTEHLPSVLVCELFDYIQKGFYIKNKKIYDHVLKKHRLQGYSIDYFSLQSGLFSYSKENYEACKTLYSLPDKKKASFFITTGFPSVRQKEADIDSETLLDIEQLSVFFKNPAKYILENRLGIFFREKTLSTDDTENFQINSLENYLMGSDMVKDRIFGNEEGDLFTVYKAMGKLPHGSAGSVSYRKMKVDASFFADTVKRFCDGRKEKKLDINLDVHGITLSGSMNGIYGDERIDFSYAKKKAKDILKAWIYHVLFCALRGKKSFFIFKDKVLEFGRVENSVAVLEDLINLYEQGMRMPLCFFPESSFEYAFNLLVKNRSEQNSLRLAQKRWEGNVYINGESEDPYYRRCFGELSLLEEPLVKEFKIISEKIFSPVFSHCKEHI